MYEDELQTYPTFEEQDGSMKSFCVIRWLSCDEYHAHSDECCYMRAMRWSDALNQESIISTHGTMEEAQKAADAMERKNTEPTAVTLSLNSQNVHMVSGKAFEKFVMEVFPRKVWEFPFQASPVFVTAATKTACKICEDAVATWMSGINGKHYHVSVTALIRHFTHKGLIPEGHYLVITTKSHKLSDESAYQGNAKGVF